MPTKIENFNVNWVNGMKINRNHFIQLENAFHDHLRDSISITLNNRNYGLLSLDIPSLDSVITEIMIDNENLIRAKIHQYRAVSQGGVRIEILKEHLIDEFKLEIDRESEFEAGESMSDFYLLLSLDLFNRQNFGELKTNEEPPRFPFTIPSYKFHIISEKQIRKNTYQPFSFFVGKISILHDKIKIHENYIPPCRTINSHLNLISFLDETRKSYNQVEFYLLSIIQKIKDKNQNTSLAQSVLSLSKEWLSFITQNQSRLQWEIPDLPPIYLFNYIATSARVIKNAIEANTSEDREEMLNYFTNWSELKQGDFEKLLNNCMNFDYEHYNILHSVEQFGEFVQVIFSLFKKLESLTYIGKKKDTGIFVKEEKKKRSFLAD